MLVVLFTFKFVEIIVSDRVKKQNILKMENNPLSFAKWMFNQFVMTTVECL